MGVHLIIIDPFTLCLLKYVEIQLKNTQFMSLASLVKPQFTFLPEDINPVIEHKYKVFYLGKKIRSGSQ